MQSLRKLKTELQVNVEMMELVDTLKGVAAAEFQSLERRKERFEQFIDMFNGFFALIDFRKVQHPFAREEGRLGVVMVTSDEGFMGGLNTHVINDALDYAQDEETELIVIGVRGANYLRSMGRENFKFFPGIVSEQRFDASLKLKDYIIQQSLSEKLNRFVLFYPKPVSFFIQKVEQLNLLPCQSLFEEYGQEQEFSEEERIAPGGRLHKWLARLSRMDGDVIVESSLESMVEYLIETWITQKLYEIFEDSKLAELSARAVHLEGSYQQLLEKGKDIRHHYFRSRHEVVDRELRDMFSSQVARHKKKRKWK